MNVRSAQVFVAVAEELSFSRAAARLPISAPHVSEIIKKLEREVGHVLFDRTPRSVELTRTAEALLPSARALLAAHGELEHRILDLRRKEYFVFGRFYGFGSSIVNDIANEMERLNETISVDVHLYDWTDPSCGLRTGDSDAAILVGPTEIDDALTRIPIGVQRRFAVVPFDAEVVPCPNGTISLDDVDRIGWVPVPIHDEVWNAAWRLHEFRDGAPRLIGLEQERIEGMIEAIQAGTGATVTIEVFAGLYTPDGTRSYPVRDVPPLPVDVAFPGNATTSRFSDLVAALRQTGRPVTPR